MKTANVHWRTRLNLIGLLRKQVPKSKLFARTESRNIRVEFPFPKLELVTNRRENGLGAYLGASDGIFPNLVNKINMMMASIESCKPFVKRFSLQKSLEIRYNRASAFRWRALTFCPPQSR